MFKDKEARECEDYLKDKDCDLCIKYWKECEDGTGIYYEFQRKGIKLRKVDKSYVKKSTSIIRTKNSCQKHFVVLKKDNDKRQELNMDIPDNLELLKFRRSYI